MQGLQAAKLNTNIEHGRDKGEETTQSIINHQSLALIDIRSRLAGRDSHRSAIRLSEA